MQILALHVVTEEHQAELLRAVAVVTLWTVKSFRLTKDLRVVELDDLALSITTSLQTNTLLRVDTSDIMSSDFISVVECGQARQGSLVTLEMTNLIARSLLLSSAAIVREDGGTSTLG